MIPKIFHHIWIGPNKLPDKYKEYMVSWKKYHPSWGVELWTDHNLPEMVNEDLYWKEQTYSGRADILRYEILYQFGGLYVDVDYECFKRIEHTIKDLDLILCCECDNFSAEIPHYLNNGLIGATPKHPIIKELIDEIPQRYKDFEKAANKDVLTCCWKTGPDYLMDTMKKHDVPILPAKTFNGELAIHHYAQTWWNFDEKRERLVGEQ